MLSLVREQVTAPGHNRALFAIFLILFAGCSHGDGDQGRTGSAWTGAVPLSPVIASVHAEGAARILGRGPGARLELRVRGLPPLDEAYVVWLYNAASDAVGVARVARGDFALRTRLPLDPANYRYIDISREPLDGNRNHSGDSVLRVRVSRLLR